MRLFRILSPYLFLFLAVGVLLLFLNGRSASHKEKKIEALAFAAIPTIPHEVEFGGEKIELKRYDLRERYDRELTGFVYSHTTTLLLLKRANRFFPLIDPILKEEGIPADFKYLAVIESSLDARSISPAKAAGMWQIMRTTGRELGLEVNDSIDERFHIEKATRAACRYLKKAYEKYGNWQTVAASYNAGMQRISKELSAQEAENALDLHLVAETSRYLFRILAVKAIFEAPYRYGFVIEGDQLYKPIASSWVEITETIPNLKEFAASYGITYAQLKDFNPWLRGRSLPNKSGRTYQVQIPDTGDLYYGKRPVKVYNKAWIVE